MEKLFIVVDIGCLCCGACTEVLGIYKSEDEAKSAHTPRDYFHHAQRSIEVLEWTGEIK